MFDLNYFLLQLFVQESKIKGFFHEKVNKTIKNQN
jgi:hypothetical protein